MGIIGSIRERLRGRRPEESTWFALAGHGLRLLPRCPVQIEHRADGTLCLGRDDGGMVRIIPGAEPAREEPTRVDTEGGGVAYCCGPRGPMLAPSLVEPLESTFIHVETGDELGPWQLLGFGFWIAFPEGFAVVAKDLDDRHPFFELHLLEDASPSSFIRFIRVARADVENVMAKLGGADWVRVGDGKIESAGGARPWVEFSYPHDDGRWHQRRYFLRVNDEFALLAIAQARDSRTGELFAGADAVARSFAPVSSSTTAR